MITSFNATEVAVATGSLEYPSERPYGASSRYPEYPFGANAAARRPNHVYNGVREALRHLRLDARHDGQKEWNPFGDLMQPGHTVVLKPNFVRHFRETLEGHDDCLVTHGSIIRAALDFVYIALKGQGRIIIADAPQNDADFDAIRQMAGLDEIQAFYRRHAGFEVEVYDLRPQKVRKVNGVICGHDALPGDPAGYVKVDLGRHSMFCEIEHLCHLLYGSEYDTCEIQSHHRNGVHEYLISRTIMDADCIVNLPKLKTHKKTGITVCMKNLVGINGNKNWLPHHRLGTPSQGGDQFADNGLKGRMERRVMACFRRTFPWLGPMRAMLAKPLQSLGQAVFGDTNKGTIRSGNWYGNDTTWRMVVDLNRILTYADRDGHIQGRPARQVLSIVDGVVGGEGNGPLDPTAKQVGVILAGTNSVAVDLTCAHLMGFDYQCLPVLFQALVEHELPIAPSDIRSVLCRSNHPHLDKPLVEWQGTSWYFRPHFGWQGHIERATGEPFRRQ